MRAGCNQTKWLTYHEAVFVRCSAPAPQQVRIAESTSNAHSAITILPYLDCFQLVACIDCLHRLGVQLAACPCNGFAYAHIQRDGGLGSRGSSKLQQTFETVYGRRGGFGCAPQQAVTQRTELAKSFCEDPRVSLRAKTSHGKCHELLSRVVAARAGARHLHSVDDRCDRAVVH